MPKQEKTGKVQTVLGLVDAKDLGITIPHEHLLINMTVYFVEPKESGLRRLAHEPVTFENLSWLQYHMHDNLDNLQLLDEELAIEEVMVFKKEGGNTIVDLTNEGIGRDPLALARISRVTGLNVVMGSGYYISDAQGPEYDAKTEEDVAEEIIADIDIGVGNTGIRAGIIGEIACTWPLKDRERKSLRAAACAQRSTGVAINVHQTGHHESQPLEIINILDDAGADLGHVVISHIDLRRLSFSTRCELAKVGCYLEYDLFGTNTPSTPRFSVLPPKLCDVGRIEQIMELIDAGYLNQILIAQDDCMKCQLLRYGGHGYAHILRNIVPLMLAVGITREQIHTIMVENPKRMLQFVV